MLCHGFTDGHGFTKILDGAGWGLKRGRVVTNPQCCVNWEGFMAYEQSINQLDLSVTLYKLTNAWDEEDERDAQAFLDLEQEIYLKLFPHNKAIFKTDKNDRDEDKVDDDDSADELSLSMLALKRAGENKTGKKRQFEKSYDDNGEIGIV